MAIDPMNPMISASSCTSHLEQCIHVSVQNGLFTSVRWGSHVHARSFITFDLFHRGDGPQSANNRRASFTLGSSIVFVTIVDTHSVRGSNNSCATR